MAVYCAVMLQEEMAQAGYRTLCVAEKEINETAWKTWCVSC